MRLLGALVAAATVLSATVVASPAAAARAVTTVTITGSGYGHGKGLSQWGAQGAAKAGRTHQQILDFYYPGTAAGSTGRKIKVLITKDTSSNVVVSHRSGLTVKSLKTGKRYKLRKSNARRWRITPVGTTRSRLSVRSTGKWRHVRYIPGQAEFRAARNAPIRLHVPKGSALYRGALRSAVPASGSGRDTVNVVSLESYLRGVVPREMPATWHPNAVRSQAVAARTYAAFERAAAKRRYFHVWDTIQSQVYGGASAEHPASDAAIRATRKQVRLFKGKPAFTQFSASNGGHTAPGPADKPYLAATPDPYDPKTPWTVTISDGVIEKAWPHIGDLEAVTVTARDGYGSWGGRAVKVSIKGTGATANPSGDSFRSILGLRSTLFSVTTQS
jgi:stage II sporulation protein D